MKYKSSNKGITLVALVITVVVMLILAGVAISAIINGDGLFNRVTQAEREHVKSSILEVVDMAKLDLTIENAETGKKIDINSLIEKIKEISIINEEDYIISVDEEEQSATIIDKKTNVVIDIWIDGNGNINTEGSIVDDIADVAKPTITYVLEPPAGTYGEKVKIIITAKEENKGIAKIEFQGNVETCNGEKEITKEYTVTENGTYKVTVEGTNGRKASINIEINNIMSAGNIVLEAQNTAPTKEDVSVKIVYDENIKVGGQALTNTDRFQYSIGENNWQTTTNAETTILVGVNGTVYARYYDGNQGYKTASITIQNIDKIEPNAFDLSTTKTTNSITVSGSTEDIATEGCAINNYGIAGYQFQLKDNEGSVITNWTTLQAETNYTFSDLTQGTTYKVSMRAVDKAGNYRDSGEITVTTKKDIEDPEEVAVIGDFVNYSVEVNGTTYSYWRILDFDNNGHMEIVCYDAPNIRFGADISNKSTYKTKYANAIKILNDKSVPYGNGTYGYSTRHLGSDPSNPSSYATIPEDYIKVYEDYDTIELNPNYPYIVQNHHESDLEAVQLFSDADTGRKFDHPSIFLASRRATTGSISSSFYVNDIGGISGGLDKIEANALYHSVAEGHGYSSGVDNPAGLAPVVVLESGVKINTLLRGNGSKR